jgi:hypothetical protein
MASALLFVDLQYSKLKISFPLTFLDKTSLYAKAYQFARLTHHSKLCALIDRVDAQPMLHHFSE